MVKCIKISLNEAETVKRDVLDRKIYDSRYKIMKEDKYLYIPVIKKYEKYKLINKELKEKENKLSFKELLKSKLSAKEIEDIGSSYDVVGDIAILEIENENKKFAAECLLKTNKNVRTVVRKVGWHEGIFRVQEYECLAGENNLETSYIESGIKIKLDISKVYFTPRLSNERMRIAKQVKANERVLVMFSGVGIYGFIISKYSKAKEIVCVEINPDACEYAEGNLKLNRIKNVKLYCADIREVVNHLGENFDRIIMPLPKDSLNFLDLALSLLNKNGIIHLYTFSDEENIKKIIEDIKKKVKVKILNIVKAGQIKTRTYRYCIDMQTI